MANNSVRSEVYDNVNRIHSKLDHLPHISNQLADLLEASKAEESREEYIERTGQVNLAAVDTTGEITLGPVPPGSFWVWDLVTVTGGPLGPCAVYFDSVSPQNLCYFVSDANIFSDTNLNIFVRERRSLIFHFYTQPGSQVCTALIQARQFDQYPRRVAYTGGD